jgi:hypothetical protein
VRRWCRRRSKKSHAERENPAASRGPERVGADLALLEWRDKDAVRPARQQAREIGLVHRQVKHVAVERPNVDGVELHFVIGLAGMERVEIGDAIYTEHRLAVDHELLVVAL